MLTNINNHFRNLYPNNQDLLEISVQSSNIKIVGFKHKEIELRLAKILEKIKSHNFPAHWDNIMSLIEGEQSC